MGDKIKGPAPEDNFKCSKCAKIYKFKNAKDETGRCPSCGKIGYNIEESVQPKNYTVHDMCVDGAQSFLCYEEDEQIDLKTMIFEKYAGVSSHIGGIASGVEWNKEAAISFCINLLEACNAHKESEMIRNLFSN